jgi:hypothetical protein
MFVVGVCGDCGTCGDCGDCGTCGKGDCAAAADGDTADAVEFENRNGAVAPGAGEAEPEFKLDALFLQCPPRLGLACVEGCTLCALYLPEFVNEPWYFDPGAAFCLQP